MGRFYVKKIAPFDISDTLVEAKAIIEKSSKKKVTAWLPFDTYSDTFSKVHYYGDGEQVPSQIFYMPSNVKVFLEAKKNVSLFFGIFHVNGQ